MSRASAPGPHVFLVAGEESGDRLGAALIAAIKRATPRPRAVFRRRRRAHGASGACQACFRSAIWRSSALPPSRRACRKSWRAFARPPTPSSPPSRMCWSSSTARNSPIAWRAACAPAAPAIPIVDYVCPSVWAWRPGRARAMRAYVDHVLALLPFEPAVMRQLGGPPCTFVGHPLSERVASLRPNAEEARRRLSDPPLLLVLPGSRASEIRRMAGVFGEAVALVAERVGRAGGGGARGAAACRCGAGGGGVLARPGAGRDRAGPKRTRPSARRGRR